MSYKLITSDKRFFPLFWTMFLGALNDNFFKNALVIIIAYKSVSLMGLNSHALVAMAGGIFILPFFLFSATAGQLSDKLSKSTLVKYTKVTEFIIMLVAGLGFLTDNFYILMVTLFLMGTQSSFFGPLKYGIIPQLLNRDELVAGNAVVGGGTFLAILLGTIVGGVAVSSNSSSIVIAVGIVIVSILGFISSLFIKKVEPVDPSVKPDFTFFKPTLDIIKITMRDKKIFHTCMGISWFWFLGAAILSILPNLCKDVFNSSESVGTLFLASFTIGMGIGSFVAEKLSQRRPEMGMVPIAALGMSIFLLDLAYTSMNFSSTSSELMGLSEFFASENSLRSLIDLFIVSIFGGMFIIPQFTFLQDYAPRNILSRIIAGNNIWNAIFMVSAAVAIMVLSGAGVSLPWMIAILATINIGYFFYIYFQNSAVTLRFIFWGLSKIFYNVEIEGRENIPDKGAVVIASNHVSFVDWIMVMAASPRPVRFVIDHIYYYKTGFTFWLKQAHLIPIATKKDNPEILGKAFENISEALSKEEVIGIFPEGWITRDGRLRKFQPGIKKIVSMQPTVVVPMVIDGLWGSFFSFEGKGVMKGFKVKRRKVKLKILPPVCSTEFDFKELEQIFRKELKQ
ncbi:putative membrane protein [Halobacteriovorax marinus SJ]|uniref:Membrane protein n=1 Tax=Halobacteriovorax marinus (strain ATCC BAA-682 / DSM 15412 / SJ) TaxID=862908 RepID=E1WYE0_HALMS|nr:MFS transporter [Halobacteriovorax marinus]CBW25988.1 putative membrane protein [Halobacteriovorax marinus SJ]